MSLRALQSRAASVSQKSACRRTCVDVRASSTPLTHKVALTALATTFAVGSILVAAPAHALPFGAAALEREQAVNKQKQALEYMIEQQYNVKKAKIASERTELGKEVAAVEEAIQKKITAEQAVISTSTVQEEIQKAEVAVAQLEKQEEAIEVQAAKIEAVIEREELLAEASKESAIEKVEAEAGSVNAQINKAVDTFLESIIVAAATQAPSPVATEIPPPAATEESPLAAMEESPPAAQPTAAIVEAITVPIAEDTAAPEVAAAPESA